MSNFSAVMETDDFLNLDAKQIMEWVSSDDIIIKTEEDVFKGIVKWVHHNKIEREKEFSVLLHQVRLNSLQQDYLVNEMVKEELITTNNECLNFVLGSLKWIFNPRVESSIRPRTCLQTQMNGIFVCGGRKALSYFPNKNMWYQLPNMFMEHQNHAAIQYQDTVYTFSKQDGADYYIPSTNTWDAIKSDSPLFVEKFCSSFVLKERKTLYAVLQTFTYDCFICYFDPSKSEWRYFVGHEKLQCWGACGVTDGQHLYVIGGTKSNIHKVVGSAKVLKIDPEDNECKEVASMNEARHDAFGTAMNGKIYIAGGMQIGEEICTVLVNDTCEMYDPSTNEWQMMPSLNVPRHSSSMVCFQEALYVVGGLKNKNKHSRELSVEVFDFKTNVWEKKSTIPVDDENEEERKKNWHYKACSAAMHRDALEEPIECYR